MLANRERVIDVNVTDFSFAQQCINIYRINRGVYNTIDQWFYENGEKEIKQRRILILDFLHNFFENDSEKHKFGKGGLSTALYQYYKAIHY